MKKLLPLLPLIMAALLLAVWNGWIRIGWSLPLSDTAGQHGNLMVNSFLASLIFLERAVTFRQKWVLLVPGLNAASVLAFAFGQPALAQALLVAGSAGFLAICIYFLYRYREWHYYVFGAGALCLLAGNVILWRTASYSNAVGWWFAFLLLTIVAERLELSKFLPLRQRTRGLLTSALCVLLLALLIPAGPLSTALMATGLGATGLWLLRYDMARKALRAKSQHRYSAVLLLAGFGWLLVTSLLLVVENELPFGYDAVLHAFFIGFVISMIFSHAPIILPAISKLPVKIYHPVMYAWFALLQLSLLARVAGDAGGWREIRRWGGMGNGIAILCFFATVAMVTARQVRRLPASKA